MCMHHSLDLSPSFLVSQSMPLCISQFHLHFLSALPFFFLPCTSVASPNDHTYILTRLNTLKNKSLSCFKACLFLLASHFALPFLIYFIVPLITFTQHLSVHTQLPEKPRFAHLQTRSPPQLPKTDDDRKRRNVDG